MDSTIMTPSGPADAVVARPTSATDGPLPGVLFFVDAFGLRPVIREMAQRIADDGHVVLVPNVFHRDGHADELAPRVDMRTPEGREAAFAECIPRVRALTPERSTPDTGAWLDALAALPGVRPGPVGVTGYCMGARLATRAACDFPERVAALGGFHGGGLATDAPDSPHLGLGRARATFCYLHADADPSMDAAAIARLQAALDEAGLEVLHNEVFPGAPHGYSMADTASYHLAATERHFELLQELFARTLH